MVSLFRSSSLWKSRNCRFAMLIRLSWFLCRGNSAVEGNFDVKGNCYFRWIVEFSSVSFISDTAVVSETRFWNLAQSVQWYTSIYLCCLEVVQAMQHWSIDLLLLCVLSTVCFHLPYFYPIWGPTVKSRDIFIGGTKSLAILKKKRNSKSIFLQYHVDQIHIARCISPLQSDVSSRFCCFCPLPTFFYENYIHPPYLKGTNNLPPKSDDN